MTSYNGLHNKLLLLPNAVTTAVVSGATQPEVFKEYRSGIVWCVSGDGVAKFVVLAVVVDGWVDHNGEVLDSAQVQEEIAVQ